MRKRDKNLRRRKALSTRITTHQITDFASHLLAVSFTPGDECWLYVGPRSMTPDGPVFKTNRYAHIRFNGQTIGAHKFALAASEGIKLSALDGYDVHHTVQCFGYRCCNPDHLEKQESRPHRGTRGQANSLNPKHVRTVKEILRVTPTKRPASQPIHGSGSRRRVLAGIPFLIKLGLMVGIGSIRLADGKRQPGAEGVPSRMHGTGVGETRSCDNPQ